MRLSLLTLMTMVGWPIAASQMLKQAQAVGVSKNARLDGGSESRTLSDAGTKRLQSSARDAGVPVGDFPSDFMIPR